MHTQQPYRIILFGFAPGVVLVLCQRCHHIVAVSPDPDDAFWAAACHGARGVGSMPTFALHLRHGWWVASCPECGFELGRRRDQAAAERAGERRRCLCRPTQASHPSYRGLRLDGPLAEFRRAVDRLRWDTVPAPLDRPASPPAAPRRGRQVDGQADLLDGPAGEVSA